MTNGYVIKKAKAVPEERKLIITRLSETNVNNCSFLIQLVYASGIRITAL
jgi:hypothetical protein